MTDLAKQLRIDAQAYRESLAAPTSYDIFALAYQWQDKKHRHVWDLCDRLETAADRIERLEAALTPFLNLPIGVIEDDPPELEVYQCHGWPRDQRAVVTVGDFYRVRKALEGKDD